MPNTFTVTVAFEDGREVTRTFPNPEDVGAYLHDLDMAGVAYAIVQDDDDAGPEDGEGVEPESDGFTHLGATLIVEAVYRMMLFETETYDAPECRALFAALVVAEPETICRIASREVIRWDAGHRMPLAR
jgi:hypothetical protein